MHIKKLIYILYTKRIQFSKRPINGQPSKPGESHWANSWKNGLKKRGEKMPDRGGQGGADFPFLGRQLGQWPGRVGPGAPPAARAKKRKRIFKRDLAKWAARPPARPPARGPARHFFFGAEIPVGRWGVAGRRAGSLPFHRDKEGIWASLLFHKLLDRI